jgi:ketose-bisphosphate aldolase
MEKFNNAMVTLADRQGYAVPAFNYSDIWELEAITEAAREERAVVYLASNMHVVDALGITYCGAMGKVAYEESEAHVLNHLDHSTDTDHCLKAVDNGYMSVMIDASACSLEENIRQTKIVVDYAHARGVVVEAEIGRIGGNNIESTYRGKDFLAEVKDAVALAESTGVDSLAVGIGNAHGFYAAKPEINVQRLKEINEVVSVPLVLHGGTGIPFETVQACIEHGIAKVNVGTLLHATYLRQLQKELSQNSDSHNVLDIFLPVRAEIKKVVKEWIEVCNAANKY